MNGLHARGARGFTLIELMVSGSILSILLYVVLSASGVITKTLDTNERMSDVAVRARQNLIRITGMLRPASSDSLRVLSAGAWIVPVDDTPYEAVRLQDLTGTPNGAVTPLSGARTIEFVLDRNEARNGKDDNGNGLIDEGCVWLTEADGTRTCLVTGVESFSFTRSSRTARIKLSCGGHDAQRRVLRCGFEEQLWLRNN